MSPTGNYAISSTLENHIRQLKETIAVNAVLSSQRRVVLDGSPGGFLCFQSLWPHLAKSIASLTSKFHIAFWFRITRQVISSGTWVIVAVAAESRTSNSATAELSAVAVAAAVSSLAL